VEKREVGKMVNNRKPFQGVKNIIHFNWPFYLVAGISSLVCLAMTSISWVFFLLAILILLITSISLFSSYWIYDHSNLYSLPWLDTDLLTNKKILNIHSGFNELDTVLPRKLDVTTLDFYNEKRHTEKSIQRARKRFPSPNSISIKTNHIPYPDSSVNAIILFLAAHEIRQSTERHEFFKELHRMLKPNGRIYITEHLRDLPNFLAYNIGFFHFHSKKTWLNCFEKTGFSVCCNTKTTPFISTFTLSKT
jgi:SAM-dependent methyltransferase